MNTINITNSNISSTTDYGFMNRLRNVGATFCIFFPFETSEEIQTYFSSYDNFYNKEYSLSDQYTINLFSFYQLIKQNPPVSSLLIDNLFQQEKIIIPSSVNWNLWK